MSLFTVHFYLLHFLICIPDVHQVLSLTLTLTLTINYFIDHRMPRLIMVVLEQSVEDLGRYDTTRSKVSHGPNLVGGCLRVDPSPDVVW